MRIDNIPIQQQSVQTRAAVVEIVTGFEIYDNCLFFLKSKVLYILFAASAIYLDKNDGI